MNLPNYSTLKPTLTLLTLALIILSLLACRKEVKGPTIIYGKVLEQGTQKPVPNALVKLVNANGNFHPNFEVIHDTTRTDENGYYEIEIDKPFREDIMVYAKAENYFNHQDDAAVAKPNKNVIPNRTQNVSINLKPYAYLGFSMNPNVIGYSIYVNTIPGFDYNEGFGFYLDPSQTLVKRTIGNEEVEIVCFKMINGLQKEYQVVKVYPTTIDTVVLELSFN